MKTDIKKHENGGAKSWIKAHLSDIIPVLGLILVLVFFHAVSGGKVFTKTNFNTLFNEAFSLLIVTYALIFVMAQGKNDMSLGGVVALAAALAAHASSISGNLVLPVALLVGLLCGLLNGLIVTELRIDSFIATIAMSFVLKGFDLCACRYLYRHHRNPADFLCKQHYHGFFPEEYLNDIPASYGRADCICNSGMVQSDAWCIRKPVHPFHDVQCIDCSGCPEQDAGCCAGCYAHNRNGYCAEQQAYQRFL